MAVLAVQAIARMRGGAQSQLMLGADSRLWVVKFQNNPQHTRVLVNELLATRMAEDIGLPVPATEVIEVTDWLIEHTADLYVEPRPGQRERSRAGLQFGSLYVGGEESRHVVDYLPEQQLRELKNLKAFAGVLAFDKWTGNCNGRQAVFSRGRRERTYRATFIDQGYCFNVPTWSFPDTPKRGVYGRNTVYTDVTGWESFEPWLTRIEGLPAERLWAIADTVPPEWYEGDAFALERLVEELLRRRAIVRDLVEAFRESDRQPFPKWRSQALPRVTMIVQPVM